MKKLERAILPGGAQRLFQSATESGAHSLGIFAGKLETGRHADFFTVDLDDPSIAGSPRDTLIDNIVFSAGKDGGERCRRQWKNDRQRRAPSLTGRDYARIREYAAEPVGLLNRRGPYRLRVVAFVGELPHFGSIGEH